MSAAGHRKRNMREAHDTGLNGIQAASQQPRVYPTCSVQPRMMRRCSLRAFSDTAYAWLAEHNAMLFFDMLLTAADCGSSSCIVSSAPLPPKKKRACAPYSCPIGIFLALPLQKLRVNLRCSNSLACTDKSVYQRVILSSDRPGQTSRALPSLPGLEKKHRDLVQVKVYETPGFMRDVRAKVSSDDTVPGRSVLGVKLFLYSCRHVLLHLMVLDGLCRSLYGKLLPIFWHIHRLNHTFSPLHAESFRNVAGAPYKRVTIVSVRRQRQRQKPRESQCQ